MSSSSLLRARAAMAVALFAGFYLLALGMVAGLLYIPYAEVVYAGRIHPKLTIFAIVGAFVILRGIWPKRIRFDPPGPRITVEEQPKLISLIHEVAGATDQKPPDDVYIVAEVNAFVTEHGSVLGLGGRRVMGIGLPLMELLSVSELRAVIAHEFGHYAGGDTRLGAWIYRTRATLGRTLVSVGDHSSMLAKPFEWYAAGFMQITNAISRAQEYVADAIAAQVSGKEAAKSALVKLTGGDSAYGAFWQAEVAPALNAGFRPPVAEGLRQFISARGVSERMDAYVQHTLDEVSTDRFDTHPSLRDRLEALANLASGAAAIAAGPGDEDPATALLAGIERLEDRLFSELTGSRSLCPVSWTDYPLIVLPTAWVSLLRQYGAALKSVTPTQLPDLVQEPHSLPARLGIRRAADSDGSVEWGEAVTLVGSAVGLAIARRVHEGHSAVALWAPPAEPVYTSANGVTIEPFRLCDDLVSGRLSRGAWTEWCQNAGIDSVDLWGQLEDASTWLDKAGDSAERRVDPLGAHGVHAPVNG